VCDITKVYKLLKRKSSKKAKESYRKFIPTAKKVYGVYSSEVNKIVSKIKDCDFEFIKQIWRGDHLEEKILGAKLLGRICNKNPDLTMKLIKKFVKDIDNWAVCDVLATQGIRKIAKIKQKEILNLSKQLIKSKNLWERRFALVLLTNYKANKLAKEIAKLAKNDKEYYVKKAYEWVEKVIK